MTRRSLFSLGGAMALLVSSAWAKNPVVGGKEMFPAKNIVENAVNSADHTTLVAAVKAAGLVDTLRGAGLVRDHSPYSRRSTTHSRSCRKAPWTRC